MIDDERLQELLAKASSLYNSGEYKGAIDAWKEALGVDPGSQKAQEGIRMATLLLGDFDAVSPGEPEEAVAVPADGADAAAAPVEETEARIDLGVARIKQLLSERKYSEAIEGAQGLLPLDPESPEIHSLLEQAQHAFESAPFIKEHLVLARELLAQERFSEAEAECKKVFALDATHPGGKNLLKEIRDKIQASLKAAASQLGGMTVKLTMPQAIAAGVKLNPRAPAAPPAAPAPPASASAQADRKPLPEMFEGPESVPGGGTGDSESGEAALTQEEVSARAALEAAFDDPALGGTAPEESPFELAGEGAGGIGSPEVVDARTVRPPTSRVLRREPAATDAPSVPAPAQATAAVDAKRTPAPPAGPIEPPPVVSGPAKKSQGQASVPPAPARPAAPHAAAAARTTPPQPAATPPAATPSHATAPTKPDAPSGPVPVAEVGEDATAAWETELTQLNLKDKERGLLRGTGAKATSKPPDAGGMDLMSLLDSGGMPGMPDSTHDTSIPEPEPVPVVKAKASPKSAAHAPAGKARERLDAAGGSADVFETPATATRFRQAERPRPVSSARRGGSSLLKYFLLLILLLGAGGGAWYVYPQPGLLPRLLGGGGQPSQPVAPPAGAPAGAVDGGHAPIPTPIGGTSRQQAAPPQQGNGASASAGLAGAPPAQVPPVAAQTPGGAAAAANNLRPGTAPAGGVTGAAASNADLQSSEPIKPATAPALSKEEMQRRISAYTADGRRLIALGKWREARAKLNAVLALDPANMGVKDLSDKAQAKIDDDQKLQDEFDSTKRLYADKDYENALRKLYRLPRDKGLGDVDLYIRNSWYNWAVALLKAGNTKDALVKLSEELAVDPDDSSALKLQEVAEKYSNRAKDRTYYAFTDGLTLRAFDQR